MNKGLLVIIAAGAVLCGGCTRISVATVESATPVGTPNLVPDKRVMLDLTLRRKIEVVQVNEGIVSGDLKKVQVVLAGKKTKPVSINYAIEWFDVDGMQVNSSSTAWKSLRFLGKEQKTVSAIAPRPNAVDFVLKLQESLARRSVIQ
jgi:uncharacterized protein YcfL